MKASELRVGNLVQEPYERLAEKIYDIVTGDDVGVGSDFKSINGEDEDYFNPIPLTEEWLLKLGFEDNSYGQFFKKVSKYSWLVIDAREQKTVQIRENVTIDDHDMDIKCYYVHQLQNLYFALTGKELEHNAL